LEKDSGLWSERALKVRDKDEQKALQCVKRLRSVQQQISQITQQLQQSENQQVNIKTDQQAIEEQILQLKTKKEMLAARQNRSHLQKSMQSFTASSIDAQGVFDRWEGTVVGDEYHSNQEVDNLSSTFEQQEDELELLSMLEELSVSQAKHSDQEGE